jgi:hypothetical protein
MASIKADERELRLQVEELEQLLHTNPTAELFAELSAKNHQLARLVETSEANPQSKEEALEAYRRTGVHARRRPWRSSPAGLTANQVSIESPPRLSTTSRHSSMH